MLLFVFVSCALALQSVRLAIKRDMRSRVSNHLFVNAQFGTPALDHKLLLTSFPTNGTGVFHCLGSLSKTYDPENENDLVRFTERGFLSSKRTLIRASVWHHCNPVVDSESKAIRSTVLRSCAEDGCDGVLNLRGESPVLRAFTAFTLTRNTLELHTTTPLDEHGAHTVCSPHEESVPSFCTFNATVDGRAVVVSLVVDSIGVTVPQWLADRREIRIDIDGTDPIILDLDVIDTEKKTMERKSVFEIHGEDEDDDDEDTRHTALAGERELALQALGPAALEKNAPLDRIIIGTGILVDYSVHKTLVPLESVSFSLAAVREHWTTLESVLLCGFYFHMVQLMLHSSMLNGMVIAGSAPTMRVQWLEWLSAAITAGAFAYLIYAVSNSVDSAALETPLVVFILIQLIVNSIMLILLWVNSRRQPHHWWMMQSSCCEQLVSLAMLTISLVVRLTVDGRTVIAVLMTMIVIGNGARNVYQGANLFMPVFSRAWNSPGYRMMYMMFTVAFNFIYPAVQLSISVFYVVTASWSATLVLTLVAIGIGMHLVDADRETERKMASSTPAVLPSAVYFDSHLHRGHNFSILHYF